MSAIADSMNMFINMDSFQGITAESVKNYLSDVHFTILVSLGEVISEFQSRFLLYKEGYYSEIDGDIHAELTEETLDTLIAFLPQSEQGFISQHSTLTSVSNSISDLMGAGIPSDFHVLDSYSTVLKRVKELKENTGTYEATHHGSDLQNFQELLAAVKAFINDYLSQDASSILNYQAGSAVKMGSFSTLENAIIDAYTTREALTEDLIAAGENEAARMEILEAEWAKQREEAGLWQWIAGAGAVIVGGICIVATAGAATPLFIAGLAAGGSAIAYGAAEMYEGEQEMYYGSIGDPYTLSYNPIRDTIFGGDQEAYDTWGFISTTAAGILIPVGQGYQAAVNTATNLGGIATRQAIAQSIMYEVGKDAISSLIGMGATQFGTSAGTALFGEEVGKWIGIGSGVFAGFASNAAIGRLDKIYNWSGVQPPIPMGGGRITYNQSIETRFDNFSEGLISFDDVIDDYAKIYGELIDSNQVWSWDMVPGAENLTAGQKAAIKNHAVTQGLIPSITVNPAEGMRYGFADFEGAGVVQTTKELPYEYWTKSDKVQFDYLNDLIGGPQPGMTWHHSHVPGQMELVPFGIHNIVPHNGGRTAGMWAGFGR